MSGLIWLTVEQVAALYADGKRGRVENWIRRGRVQWKLEHSLRWVDAESVETYLRDRGTNGFRKEPTSG